MNVAVYCSAKSQIPEEYLRLGDRLGKWLAENGLSLVFGGATGGLMTRVSEAFANTGKEKRNGQRLIGVVPEHIVQSGRKSEICDELHIVTDMCERKRKMRETADCFICLPGSYGTLDEMFDVIASGTVGEHNKPIAVLNYKGFYEGLKAETERMKELQFLPAREHYQPAYIETLEELYVWIENIRSQMIPATE